MNYQQTVKQAFSLEGVGIHLGKRTRVTVHPAPAEAGRVFLLRDGQLPALANHVIDTTRCTTLGNAAGRVSTVEHLLSALYACGIDNALIEVDGLELPILDGSALPYVQAIQEAGIETLSEPAHVLLLANPLSLQDGQSTIQAEPASTLEIIADVDFADWPEGAARTKYSENAHTITMYASDVAPARTFAFRREIEALLAAGLAQGGSLENALVISPGEGFSSELRLPAEWCAHKLLDVIGDLALVGRRLKMTVHAYRPGHRMNTRFAQELLKLYPSL